MHHHQAGTGSVLVNSGHLHLESGDIDCAASEAQSAFALGEEKHDQILMARARILQTTVELARAKEQLGENPDVSLHANRAVRYAEEAIELAKHTQNRRLLAEAYIAHGSTAADEFFEEWETARDYADRATALLDEDDRDRLLKELNELKSKFLRSDCIDRRLRLWSIGEVGNKTFQQIHEEFAELVIPKVWLKSGKNVTVVAHKLSVSPKKIRRILPDWEQLRRSASDIKAHTLTHLDHYLVEFERNCERAGGQVHWARDADEADTIAIQLIRQYVGEGPGIEVIKVKTMTSDEVQMNAALEAAGITPIETDLADMIVQMGHDEPSHIVVPALHKNRFKVAEIFRRTMNLPELTDAPEDLANAARIYLRDRFLRVGIGISGANFAVAETGSVCVVESEGDGRMCVTMPDVLITLVGIEKVVPTFLGLEVFLQLLPRSSTGERMNPYNSFWTGVAPGDGLSAFHVILLDNGRTRNCTTSVNVRRWPAFAAAPASTLAPFTVKPAAMPMVPSTRGRSARSFRRNCRTWNTRVRCPMLRRYAAHAMKSVP
jgi:tetratricopeptide (TPR) repeat protein